MIIRLANGVHNPSQPLPQKVVIPGHHMVMVDGDVLVPVGPVVLVDQPQGVTDLMGWLS